MMTGNEKKAKRSMGKKQKKTCYMCGSPAPTAEHFPPKSFFPKGAGLTLKTVPSCKLHNNDKSTDDQYVLAQICMNAARGVNLAKEVFKRSVVPIFQQSPDFQMMIARYSEVLDNGLVRYPVDISRFDNFFDSLSCAVYFDKFGCQFDPDTHTIKHVYLSLSSDDEFHNAKTEFMRSTMEVFFNNFINQIEHFEADRLDEVVYANDIMAPAGAGGSITIAHTFYGVFEVVSLMSIKVQANL